MLFTERRIELARRKERLIARAEAQRTGIAASFEGLRTPIAVADRALAVACFFKEHPLLLAAVIAAATALRRRNLIGLLGRGLAAWRAWRWLSAWSAKLFA